ncbi:MAG: hydroxyquinol 1,2-dioxygenase [Hyphomicrobiales bacterium]|nr:hydroxyquinol 1,2-dioxygenase [Hyphomicrobiales bacterium]MCP4998597.1 hydroxyquinol 1,2-dioxygenase [Hyphomicrobiales bacterium]
MRDVTAETLTKTFLDYCGPETSPRLRFLLEQLAGHLHAFVMDTGLTHAEWRKAIEILTKAGEITDDERNEFVLLSDVLGVSSLVDMVNTKAEATSSSVLGPFHILGAPDLAYGGDLKRDNDGATLVVKGVVRDTEGNPVSGAAIELWQTADNGLYSNLDPKQDRYNLRARLTSVENGEYGLTTIRPAPYTVPDDGPVGELLHATGRHPWRPSHLHFIITAPGYHSLVTEVFPSDDPYLDEDAVFGVRGDLIMEYVERTDPGFVPEEYEARDKLTNPYYSVDFDFVLAVDDGA